ncbi:hypothetical protein RS030_91568 [Cryptosporidium xiaoi]|uniref:T-cell immunomodulatory protein TIP C2 domain-containing protein n=1 Tax=Cryptosporidium xiaoi TaxID=659607 RepID=A0AAV9XSU7_9CRYT
MNLKKNELFNPQRWLLLAIIVVMYSNIVFCDWNIEWIKSKLLLKASKSDGNIENFNFNEIPGRILSFIDFNNDKFTDIIVYSESESTIRVLLWNSTVNNFVSSYFFEFKDGTVASSLPGDWNGDGNMDILLTYYIEKKEESNSFFSSKKIKNEFGMALFVQNIVENNHELIELWRTDLNNELTVVEPLVFDLNGDGLLDLLCESKDGKRFVLLNFCNSLDLVNLKRPFKRYNWGSDLSEWIDIGSSQNKGSYGRLVENHSSAFIDMDGDCRSDLVLEVYFNDEVEQEKNHLDEELGIYGKNIKKGLEIWINTMVDGIAKFRKYVPETNSENINNSGLIILPHGSGSISYSDFNRDGTIDLIVPVCVMGKDGCESKSRLVFIPNIHEYNNCITDSKTGFFGYNNLKEYNSGNNNLSIRCKNSKMLCKSSAFTIHSFTDDDNSLIFRDTFVTEKKKQSNSFFSSLFGGSFMDKNIKPETTLHNGFTVSLIYDNNGEPADNEIIIDKVDNSKETSEDGVLNDENDNQFNVMANQMVSLFSFFPNKQKSKDIELQWGLNNRGTVIFSVGDFNSDGYPDLLAVVMYPNNTRQLKLIENLPIILNSGNDNSTFNLYTGKNTSSNKFGLIGGIWQFWYNKLLYSLRKTMYWFSGFVFSPEIYLNSDSIYRKFGVSRIVDTFSDFSVDYGAFFDIYDNGFLDIISISYPYEKAGKSLCKVNIKFASIENTNLFIKVSALSYISSTIGNAVDFKTSGGSSKINKANGRNGDIGSDHNNGVTSYGTTIRIRMTSLTGNDIFMSSSQFSQSTNGVLQTPFVIFGLGKTNNYIEELYVGTNYATNNYIGLDGNFGGNNNEVTGSSNLGFKNLFDKRVGGLNYRYEQFKYSYVWTGLIPNTRVIAQLNPLNNPQVWTLVLSVSPKKSLKGILIASIIALFVIGVIVLILDQREKAEDLKEHQGFKSNFISA